MDIDPHPTRERREREIQFKTPKNTLNIWLPRVSTESYYDPGKREVVLGMHTDMLSSLLTAVRSLKEPTREKLLIEGRFLNTSQWNKLKSSPLWEYFWSRRAYRAGIKNQKEIIKLIVPKKIKVSEKQMKKYLFLEFGPSTFSEEFGFKTAWYSAEGLLSKSYKEGFGPNSLERILGACNQFRIGSNSLSLPLLNLTRGRITEQFRQGLSDMVKDKVMIEDKILGKIAKIVDV